MSSENGCSHYEWCTEDKLYGCAFPPTMLKRMLEMFESDPRAGYNEVVVDPEHMVIEAVWGRSAKAAEVHRKILDHWGLNENQLPLINLW